MKFGSSVDVIKSSMEQAAAFEIHALKRRLNLLAFIVNAAPLLGLLGHDELCVWCFMQCKCVPMLLIR